MYYYVNEVFQSIQGEGYFCGTSCVFIRLQGCNVGCPWCDTKHTWHKRSKNKVSFKELITKKEDSESFAQVTSDEILAYIKNNYESKHVVITGGEPCIYNLEELTSQIIDLDYQVQIETSGCFNIYANSKSWLTLSPKIENLAGFTITNDAIEKANELKFIIAKQRDINVVKSFLTTNKENLKSLEQIYLQPLSQKSHATKIALDACIKNNWRLSLQMHKYLNIR